VASDERVAVVMITRNRRHRAVGAVSRLVALPEQPRVVVVDNGSTDGTAEALAAEVPEADVVAVGENLAAAGRNLGARRVAAPYVAFCDDDMAWEPGALRRAADVLDRHPSVAVVAARVLVGPEARQDETCRAMAESPLPPTPALEGLDGRRVLGFVAGAAVVRREAFLSVGGFEPRLMIGGEEELLALDLAAAGWELVYVPHVVVRHTPNPRQVATWPGRWQFRNRLWVSWLRHPVGFALRRTVSLVIDGRPRRHTVAAALRALAGLPWVLRERRRVPAGVGADLRLLADADLMPRDRVA
jgi:GT2 family glycosyltransferase